MSRDNRKIVGRLTGARPTYLRAPALTHAVMVPLDRVHRTKETPQGAENASGIGVVQATTVDIGTWFQFHPHQVLTQINRIPDASLRGDILLIGTHALAEGGLSQDASEIAWITGLPEKRIKQLIPYLLRLQDDEWAGQTMPNFAADMVREQSDYREKKAKAGKVSAERRKQTPPADDPPQAPLNDVPKIGVTPIDSNDPQQCSTPFNTVDECSTKQTDRQTDKQTNRQTNTQNAGAGDQRLSDVLGEIFPGLVSDRRAMEMLTTLAIQFHATSAQIRGFPDWLTRNHPKKALNHFAFRDHFHQSLKGDLKTGNAPQKGDYYAKTGTGETANATDHAAVVSKFRSNRIA